MDKDKLNEAARAKQPCGICSSSILKKAFIEGFEQGAQWLIQQPLVDRLTYEEKEKIKKLYNKVNKDTYDNTIEGAIKCTISVVVMNSLVSIFGKELFNEK